MNDLSEKEMRKYFKEFTKEKNYQNTNETEKTIGLQLNGIMFFQFEQWLKKKLSNG